MSGKGSQQNFYDAIKPILWFLKISGLWYYSINHPFNVKNFEMFFIVTITLTRACVVYFMVYSRDSYLRNSKSKIVSFGWMCTTMMSLFCQVLLMVQQLSSKNELQTFHGILVNFDKSENFSLAKKKWTIFKFFLFIVAICCAISLINIIVFLMEVQMDPEYSFCYPHIILFCYYYSAIIISPITLIFACWSLKQRFQRLNETLRTNFLVDQHKFVVLVKVGLSQKRNLQEIVYNYDQLCDGIDLVNSNFSFVVNIIENLQI